MSGYNDPDWIERDDYKRGQRDALSTLLESPLVDESVVREIRFAAYEERSIPKAIVDEAIEKANGEKDDDE